MIRPSAKLSFVRTAWVILLACLLPLQAGAHQIGHAIAHEIEHLCAGHDHSDDREPGPIPTTDSSTADAIIAMSHEHDSCCGWQTPVARTRRGTTFKGLLAPPADIIAVLTWKPASELTLNAAPVRLPVGPHCALAELRTIILLT